MVNRDHVRALLYGLAVGDALGLPAELRQRAELARNPVTDLVGHGTHDQPAGTWSDDTALALCQAEALAERVPVEVEKFVADMHEMLLRWYEDAEWTARGTHFDLSLAMRTALMYLESGVDPAELPEFVEHAHGNGALVRCLPLALVGRGRTPTEVVELVGAVSSLTHPHPVAKLTAAYGVLLSTHLMAGHAPAAAVAATRADLAQVLASSRPSEATRARLARLLEGELAQRAPDELNAAGDAADCLEVALWCLLNTGDFRSAVLHAANLGDDADSNSALTGGLAGLAYGSAAIPGGWVQQLARSADIAELADRLALSLA